MVTAARVRKICKLDPDVKIISKDALTAITAVTVRINAVLFAVLYIV